ncbi:hypothetical protein A2397_04165 [Candidatus Amesbacteria bacterium RIFOXYB1_FULL_44_23]|uniref:Uncharacterized protein n=1 Tax=Candidatus Amesbacteria bacterium RIFOXYB1_FULL_44_23 TaxID=1797263 RepID=A0A1F4ZSD4_9BACT|nr:MAG: hypothetical protein A2397_04165 [Candidatus Amesbacteria bacterium RIFOXYB1_FULL_44_23]
MNHKKILLSLIIIFVAIRSLHFTKALNFSTDQGLFSSNALAIYQKPKLLLIGPTFSVNLNGRYAYQGSVIYYFQLLFMMLGRFDPVISSYLFMLFAAVSLVPLYIGVKLLAGSRAALLMATVYTLLPYYIRYTRFFWNPNSQLVLSAWIILLIGLYKKYRTYKWLLVLTVAMGVVLQFHYQFLLVIAAVGITVLVTNREKLKTFAVGMAGLMVGFSSLIIFELRHNFYNLQTIWLFLKYRSSIGNNPTTTLADYYFLSLSLFALLGLVLILKKIKWPVVYVVIGLLIWSLLVFVPQPTHGFRMANDWDYSSEAIVHELIMKEGLTDFNVVNLVYDTKAATQKFLLKKDGIQINEEDYFQNAYLFVIGPPKTALSDPAYEVATFKPALVLKRWRINQKFDLFLLKKD